MRDISQIEFFKDLKIEYITDSLTQTLNKEAITNYIEHLILNNKAFSLFFIDIDDFKEINDNLGHQVGDQALSDVARQINRCVGEDGLVGRFGGDEFVVVIEELTEYDDVWKFCRYITQSIKKNELDYLLDVFPSGSMSVTLGAAKYPEDASNIAELINVSDKALYRGKSKGKNCFVIYNKELHSNIKTVNEGGKLDIDSIVEHIFYEFSNNKTKPITNLRRIIDFITNYFNIDLIAKTNEDYFKVICNNNEALKPSYIPIELYLKTSGDVPIYAINYRTNLNSINKELFDYFVSQEIRSTLFIRCATKNKLYGYLRVDNKRERIWNKEEKYILQLIANLYAYTIELKNLDF